MVEQAQQPHLSRSLGLASAIAVVVGSTIGSGIFRTPSGIAQKLHSPAAMLAVWGVGGLLALCGALTLMEVGGAFPFAGGLYVFIREAYGRLAAFLFGWAQLLLIRPVSLAAVSLVFGEYAMRLFESSDSQSFHRNSVILAIGAILIVGVVNYRGVKLGAGVQNVTTIAKVAGLLSLIVLALGVALPKSGGHFSAPVPHVPLSFSAFGLALISVLWSFDGWADVSYVSGEVANPRKNLPRAILGGTLIITAIYLLANVAYFSVLPTAKIEGSALVAADVMSALIGPNGLAFIVATVMISTFGTLNGSMLTSPRIFFALAEDRLFFPAVARVHPRYQTPHVSTAMTCVLGVIFVSIASFDDLVDAFVNGMLPFYALAVGSIFVFRSRAKKSRASSALELDLPPDAPETLEQSQEEDRPPYDPPVRSPLYPVLPALFVCANVAILANTLIDRSSRFMTLLVLGGVLAGIPVYFATVGRKDFWKAQPD